MRRALLSVVIVLTIAAVPLTGQGKSGEHRPATSVAPKLIPAVKFDTSPPLRDIPPAPESSEPLRELPRGPHEDRHGSARLTDALDPVLQDSPGIGAPAALNSIDGIDNIDQVLPPDANGDVGPNHYVQWVNLHFAVYSKGTDTTPPALIYGPVPGQTLWTGFGGPCETRNDGDPVVLYDHLADRWFMSQFAIPNSFLGILFGPFYQCIAVSATSDPTGAYYRYQFAFDRFGDYPKFGVWPDGYYMAINQFEQITLRFAGQGVVAFPRDRMLAGQPASMVYFDLDGLTTDSELGGMLPADLDGPPPPPGSPNYFVQMDDDAFGAPADRLQLWGFHADWTTPANSTFTRLAVLPTAPFDSNMCAFQRACIPQPGTTVKLDALSDRLMFRLQYRNFGDHESLVTNHTVDVNGFDHAGIRWYEIRNPGTAAQIFQQGTYAPDADHRWMASAAMDRSGNLGIGFSVSGSVFPSVRYTGRLATDQPGLLTQGEGELVAGSGVQTHSASRWGDYSMLAVDPVDDCTFWYTQEYYAVTSSAGWRTRIGTFRFPSCGASSSNLPAVTVTASTPQAAEAGLVPGAFTFARSGDTTSALTIHYSVGGSASPGSDYVPLSSTITFDAGAATMTIPVTPLDDLEYEGNESITVTVSAGTDYVIGAPGTAVVTILSDDIPPDLIVTALTAPAAGGADMDVIISDTTRNQGSGLAIASATGFYLSTNTTLESTDVFLGSRPVPQLDPAVSDTASTTLHIPATTASGSYFILAKADWNTSVLESIETNNVRASVTIRIGPDLIVAALTVPSGAGPGGALTVSDTTRNQGGGSAAATVTRFYLSKDSFLDVNDVKLGDRSLPILAPGVSDQGTTTVTIPATTVVGTYFVIAQADATLAVLETTETNNTRVSTMVKVGPDLIVSAITVPFATAAGASINVTNTTTNQAGGGPAGPSATGFYLSANSIVDAGDVFLGSRSVGPLASGTSDTATTPLTVPAGAGAGLYFIIGRADTNAAVAETAETNNDRASAAIRIGGDLVITAVAGPGTAAAGGSITVTDTTANQGAAALPQSSTGFYLSLTTTFSPSAVFLGSRTVAPLAASTSESGSTPLTIPAGTGPGTYFVLAVADWNATVAESNESNNLRTSNAVRVGPDLTVSSFGAPTSIVAGTTVSGSDITANQGGDAAPASVTKVYLSTNGNIDVNDALIASRPVSPLAAGQSQSGTLSLTIPASTPAGSYYLIATADGDNTIAESSETNNTRLRLVTITAP